MGEIFWEGEGTIASGVCFWDGLANEGEDVDVGEIGTQGREQTELGVGVGGGGDDDDATLDRGCAIGHGGTGGDRSGDLEGEKTFAQFVVAVEQGNT